MDDEPAVAASLKPVTNTLTSAACREELRCRLVLKGENSVLGMETAPS
jgi:hypothetical protein